MTNNNQQEGWVEDFEKLFPSTITTLAEAHKILGFDILVSLKGFISSVRRKDKERLLLRIDLLFGLSTPGGTAKERVDRQEVKYLINQIYD